MEEKKSIGMLVKQIGHIYEKELNLLLKRVGITSSQYSVLHYLFQCGKENITQRDIEKQLSLRNPTVTGLLKRLDEKGFVFAVPGTEDRRCKHVFLTEKAYDIQRRMEAERRKIDKKLTLGMNKKEKEQLEKLLDKVLYNIDEP